MEGRQTVSFWSPLDPVREATLRCVVGSHLWPKAVLPTRWLSETNFYPDEENYMPVPDPDAEGMDIREFAMEPDDAVAFNYMTLHGAREHQHDAPAGVLAATGARRRPLCRTARPYIAAVSGHDMVAGQRLREDWFPRLFDRASA